MKGIKIYHYALSYDDCSIRYIDRSLQFSKMRDIAINICLHFPIMLALCLMLSMTYYAQNYTGIIGGSLKSVH